MENGKTEVEDTTAGMSEGKKGRAEAATNRGDGNYGIIC